MTDQEAPGGQAMPPAETPAPGDAVLARVATAARRTETVTGAPLGDHGAIYQEIHGELQAALAEIDGD